MWTLLLNMWTTTASFVPFASELIHWFLNRITFIVRNMPLEISTTECTARCQCGLAMSLHTSGHEDCAEALRQNLATIFDRHADLFLTNAVSEFYTGTFTSARGQAMEEWWGCWSFSCSTTLCMRGAPLVVSTTKFSSEQFNYSTAIK